MSSTEWQAVLAMQVTQDKTHLQGPAAAPVTLFSLWRLRVSEAAGSQPRLRQEPRASAARWARVWISLMMGYAYESE